MLGMCNGQGVFLFTQICDLVLGFFFFSVDLVSLYNHQMTCAVLIPILNKKKKRFMDKPLYGGHVRLRGQGH